MIRAQRKGWIFTSTRRQGVGDVAVGRVPAPNRSAGVDLWGGNDYFVVWMTADGALAIVPVFVVSEVGAEHLPCVDWCHRRLALVICTKLLCHNISSTDL